MLANHPAIQPFIVPQSFDPESESLEFDHNFLPENAWRFHYYHNGENDDDENASIAMLFQWSSPDVWEIHMLAKPDARGGEALVFAKQTVADMFTKQNAKELWGQTPIWNERARAMHRKVGGIPRGFGHHPMFGEVELFATSRTEWDAQ